MSWWAMAFTLFKDLWDKFRQFQITVVPTLHILSIHLGRNTELSKRQVNVNRDDTFCHNELVGNGFHAVRNFETNLESLNLQYYLKSI